MGPLRASWEFLRDLVTSFNEDQVPFMAAAMSYFAFFSLFPLLLGLIALAGYVLAPEEAMTQVMTFAARGLPGQEAFLRSTLEAVVEARGGIGLVALVTLLWSGKNIFFSFGTALDQIWENPPPQGLKGVLVRHALSLGFAVALGGAVIVVTALYWLLYALLALEIPFLGIQPRQIPGILPLLSNVLPLTLVTLGLVAMFRLLPSRRLPLLDTAVGAAVAAVLWELVRRVFTWYLSTFSRYHEVYGPAASVIAFLFWLYLTAILFLLGAEVAWVLQGRHRAGPGGDDNERPELAADPRSD